MIVGIKHPKSKNAKTTNSMWNVLLNSFEVKIRTDNVFPSKPVQAITHCTTTPNQKYTCIRSKIGRPSFQEIEQLVKEQSVMVEDDVSSSGILLFKINRASLVSLLSSC